MPSRSYQTWVGRRMVTLDEIEKAHSAVGGVERGRRYETQQINQAYAVLLASQFQGFCRDLHTECVEHLVRKIAHGTVGPILFAEMTRGRQLDRGNAQPGSLGTDFDRFKMVFWPMVDRHDPKNEMRRKQLEQLNHWRNAIVHQSFDSTQINSGSLRLAQVRRWRKCCQRLARSFDAVMLDHLQKLTGTPPW